MPSPIQRNNSKIWWFRKKVPVRLRPLVGVTQVWKSLKTEDPDLAAAKCVAINTELKADWARLERSKPAPDFEPVRLTQQELFGLQRATHERMRDRLKADPPTGFGALARVDGERIGIDPLDEAAAIIRAEGFDVSEENVTRFAARLGLAKAGAIADLKRAAAGDYSDNETLARMPILTKPALDLLKAFEEYAAKGGLKGGARGPTAKRWRPKIKAFAKWLGHRDLARMTTEDGYRWADHLVDEGYARKSIRDVWIASLSATAGFMLERRRLAQNPFRGIKVRDDAAEKAKQELIAQPRQKGFMPAEATTILTATVATPSHLISIEMRAARRWLPWLCAYSGARVNELTSLYPRDVTRDPVSKVWCMVIKPSLEKTSQWRTVPIHSHVIEQGFLGYAEERRKAGLPLFYDPARGRGGTAGNPQFKKVAERVGEWVRGLGIPIGVQPNHAWRHTFKSVARHVGMDREVEGFITGHRPKNANAGHDYGDRWIATMAAEIEKYPRYKIAALKKKPTRTSASAARSHNSPPQQRRRRSEKHHARSGWPKRNSQTEGGTLPYASSQKEVREGLRRGHITKRRAERVGLPPPMLRIRENRRKTRIPIKPGRSL
jgi:site-specific recombinase XerD